MRLLLGKGQDVTMYDTRKDIEMPDDISKAKSKYDIKVYAGEDIDVSAYDLAVISPGVDPETEIVRKLKDAGAEIISELELAYRYAKGKFIAITGTNGKTTTTTLAGEIFKNAGFDVRICGNIGRPVSESLENSNEDTYFVTEVSSFQLEAISKFKPFISIILNITEDHLDRHKTMENYIAAKCRAVRPAGSGGCGGCVRCAGPFPPATGRAGCRRPERTGPGRSARDRCACSHHRGSRTAGGRQSAWD